MTLPIVYCYPGCRWDQPPGRHRLIMEAMAELHPVVFLNDTVLSGKVFEPKRPRVEKIHQNLTVIHNAFGLRFSRLGRKMGRSGAEMDGSWLHAALRSIGATDYIYWLSAPVPNLLWGMRTDRLVYDCIDPCFDGPKQAEYDAREESIAKLSRLTFCTAETLLERICHWQPNAFLVPNACDPNTYHPDKTRNLALPTPLLGRPRPIIGYMGTFDWRIDAETLTEAARGLPEYTFAMLGRINADQEQNLRGLRALPNVIMPGAVSEQDGWAYTAAFDVGLIPFRPGPMNDAINPVKMHMYLVAGKPVVSTWINECRRTAPFVRATRTAEEFVAAVRRAVEENSPEQAAARTAFAMKNTWRDRAATALSHLSAQGLLSP